MESKESSLLYVDSYVNMDNKQSFANLKHLKTSKHEFNDILKNLCSISQFNVDIYTGMQHREARKSFTIAFNNHTADRDVTEEETAGQVDFQNETFK